MSTLLAEATTGGTIVTAAVIMAGLGTFFGVALAVANRVLRVEEDPRLDVVEGLLPGTNCGACGEPGCRGFAERLLAGGKVPSACTVSSPAAVEAIAELLGVDAGAATQRVARLHCAGGRRAARQIAAYEGHESCRGAHLVAGGGKGCAWGCLGLADCRVACPFEAIVMNEDGLPVVLLERCTACGNCVDACPRDLFTIEPVDDHLVVQCRCPLAGEAARNLCSVACDACSRCAQDAAPGLIRMENNLPVVDPETGGPASPEATYRCPTGAIRWVRGQQFASDALSHLIWSHRD